MPSSVLQSVVLLIFACVCGWYIYLKGTCHELFNLFTLPYQFWLQTCVFVVFVPNISTKSKTYLVRFTREHRRRIYTEEKAKVVAFVWGEEFIYFLAALYCSYFALDDWNYRMNCTGKLKQKDEFILFFKIVPGKIDSAAKN